MHLPPEISREITDHFTPHFKDFPTDYVCVYGSSVYAPDKLQSDVDLFLVTHNADNPDIEPVVHFVKDMHDRYGRQLDEEVPYHNKIHYTAAEIENAIQFGGFEVNGASITVPAIRKEKAFLESPAIKARLALNALTTPHVAIGDDLMRYHIARQRAGEAATLLAISLLGKKEFDIASLHGALTVNDEGATGEMFLGYKTEYPAVGDRLSLILRKSLASLAGQDLVKVDTDTYRVGKDFDPLDYIKTAPSA
ncbi:MAG TPA: hypothetical protein VF733_06475 [Candidatus Saccharimonadales bacterium]